MTKINEKAKEETRQPRSGMITARHIQPAGNVQKKKAAPIVIHGMAMSRHLNSN
ncbi:hypothetical protein [Bacillus sp. NPDC060175]|uniref:hypothetical protein n=1 Tax=Bacillus sp. NPDC060175 TaxID=3347061 RepID=UPI0036472FEC